MFRILYFLLILTLIAVVIVTAITLLSRVLQNIKPGKSKVEEDLRKMKEGLQLFINELVPWDKNELDLLSFNQLNKTIGKGMIKTGEGIITSIYHEPMIAWSYKHYLGGKEEAVLFASTSHHEFTYHINKTGTTVSIDNEVIGAYKNNGHLYEVTTGKLIAQIDREHDRSVLPVLIGEKEVATIKSKKYLQQTNPRAFELVTELEDKEEAILLSLTVLEIVHREMQAIIK